MSRKPVMLIAFSIILLTACLLAGCYLYSLPNYCQSLPGHPQAVVIHYACEAP